jgi:hypothetical protein
MPVWLVLLISFAACVGLVFYRHLLEARITRLQYRLKEESTIREKQIELLQERHKKKLDALDEVHAAVREFGHACGHLKRGNATRAAALKRHFEAARTLSRKYESLLGSDFYDAILKYTDLGIAILQAKLTITESTVKELEEIDEMPKLLLNELNHHVGRSSPVTNAENIVEGLNESASQYSGYILARCKLSDEFNEAEFDQAEEQVYKKAQDLLRTIPALS